jgi:hypothetical protein
MSLAPLVAFMLKQRISPLVDGLFLSLWLLGAALFAGHALTSPTFQCRTQGAEVTLPVSPPPPTPVSVPKKAAQGFDVIELLVPSVTGSVK